MHDSNPAISRAQSPNSEEIMKIPWGLSRHLSGKADVYHGKGPGIDSQTTKQQEKGKNLLRRHEEYP